MTGTRGEQSPSGRVTSPLDAVLASSFAVVALVLIVTAAVPTSTEIVLLLLLTALFAVADRTEYVHPLGRSTPTEPVLVALLLLTPLHLVPAAVLVALCLAGLGGSRSGGAVVSRLASGVSCLGPVVVLHLLGRDPVAMSHWGTYAVALLSEFVIIVMLAVATSTERGPQMLRRLAWTLGIDSMLALIGLAAVLAATSPASTVVLVAMPTALIALLVQDRQGVADQEGHLELQVGAARIEARLDPLTGLGNRRAWSEAVAAAQSRLTEQPGLAAGLVAADLNFLKYANDSYGHEVGDELIVTLGAVLRAALPEDAVVCRMGGDEFAALIVRPSDALALADHGRRIRSAVQAYGLVAGVPLSAAVGTAGSPPEPSIAAALAAADDAVYSEKRRSRASRRGDLPEVVVVDPTGPAVAT